jgi:hypothetical protein
VLIGLGVWHARRTEAKEQVLVPRAKAKAVPVSS